MLSAVSKSSSQSSINTALLKSTSGSAPKPDEADMQVRTKFQDFVGGTFYKQMLKSLRSTQGKAAYMDGGQGEKVFRDQLDQYISESMAKQPGGAQIAGPLFDAYSRSLNTTV